MFSTYKTFINTKNSTEVTSVTIGRLTGIILTTETSKTSGNKNNYQSFFNHRKN